MILVKFKTENGKCYCNPSTVQYLMPYEGNNTYIVYESPSALNEGKVSRNGIVANQGIWWVKLKLSGWSLFESLLKLMPIAIAIYFGVAAIPIS